MSKSNGTRGAFGSRARAVSPVPEPDTADPPEPAQLLAFHGEPKPGGEMAMPYEDLARLIALGGAEARVGGDLPAPLLAEMRRLDTEIAIRRARQEAAIQAFGWTLGVDFAAQSLQIDIDSGRYQVVSTTPAPEPAPAPVPVPTPTPPTESFANRDDLERALLG